MVELGITGIVDAQKVISGGFGTVYRATQVNFGRTVAVKLLPPDIDEAGWRQVRREMRALGTLSSHPNIVTLFDAGVTAEGRAYLLMEYAEQGSLEDVLARQGPLPSSAVISLIVRVAGALQTAHDAKILHRDVKPANILLSQYDEPKLADFGIATLRGATTTVSGRLAMTLAHAAPELLNGDSPSIASDIYGLASTTYTLLAGRPPFARKGASVAAIIRSTALDDPPDLRDEGVPTQVSELITRALAKHPSDRPASAAEYGRSLADVVEGTAGPAPQIPLVARDLTLRAAAIAETEAGRSGPGTAVATVDDTNALGDQRRGFRRTRLIGASTVAIILVAAGLQFTNVGFLADHSTQQGTQPHDAATIATRVDRQRPSALPSAQMSGDQLAAGTSSDAPQSRSGVQDDTTESENSRHGAFDGDAAAQPDVMDCPFAVAGESLSTIIDAMTIRHHVVVCASPSGQAYYRGSELADPLASIMLPATEVTPEVFQASNGAYTYTVHPDRLHIQRDEQTLREDTYVSGGHAAIGSAGCPIAGAGSDSHVTVDRMTRRHRVIVCQSVDGTAHYHGLELDDPTQSITVPAVRSGRATYEATNGAYRYVVEPSRLLVVADGEIVLDDPFVTP